MEREKDGGREVDLERKTEQGRAGGSLGVGGVVVCGEWSWGE